MININELRRLAQAATSGEWYVVRGNHIYGRKKVTDGEEEWHPLIACTDDDEVNVSFEVNAAFIAAANPAAISELLDRLEAAESECLEQARLNGMGSEREAALLAKLEAAEKERDECNRRRLEAADHFAAQTALMKKKYYDLRAKVAEMERQEPVAWARKLGLDVPSFGCVTDLKYRPSNIPESSYIPLYALPGAKGEEK